MAMLKTPTAEEAVDIWIMKWRGRPVVHITSKYGCDPRRCYEIFHGTRYPKSREVAFKLLLKEDPCFAALVSTGQLDPKRRKKEQENNLIQLRFFE